MKGEIVLTEEQIVEIKKLADSTRKEFGIFGDVPIAKDIFMLLEKKDIILCQYPFQTEKESHMDANITWFETEYGFITFIGLNTSLYYDEQIFALAHELYHFITKTGKAYEADEEDEDMLTEKKADRFAAELLLPDDILRSRIVSQFKGSDLSLVTELQLLRFIARLQGEWWIPYRSIVFRIWEEGYIGKDMFDHLFCIDARDPDSKYGKIFSSMARDCYKILNEKTRCIEISSYILEMFIQNYEDGNINDDDFVELLELFGKSPEDFGFELCVDAEDVEELQELFEGGDADEG